MFIPLRRRLAQSAYFSDVISDMSCECSCLAIVIIYSGWFLLYYPDNVFWNFTTIGLIKMMLNLPFMMHWYSWSTSSDVATIWNSRTRWKRKDTILSPIPTSRRRVRAEHTALVTIAINVVKRLSDSWPQLSDICWRNGNTPSLHICFCRLSVGKEVRSIFIIVTIDTIVWIWLKTALMESKD